MSKAITIYKFLTSEMKSANGNSGVWKLGKWKKWDGKLKLCKCGFHGSESPLDSLQNIWGDVWAVGEARGNIVRGHGKLVASEMRITKLIDTKKACVEFEVACAERCLHKFEEQYPNDDRPSKAIDAAKAWLLNPCEETKEAARSAAERKWQEAKFKEIIERNIIQEISEQ